MTEDELFALVLPLPVSAELVDAALAEYYEAKSRPEMRILAKSFNTKFQEFGMSNDLIEKFEKDRLQLETRLVVRELIKRLYRDALAEIVEEPVEVADILIDSCIMVISDDRSRIVKILLPNAEHMARANQILAR